MNTSLTETEIDHLRDDLAYWWLVEATIRAVFQTDIPPDLASLRGRILARSWEERQIFYNREPLDIAAGLLDRDASEEEAAAYWRLADQVPVPDVPAAQAPVPAQSVDILGDEAVVVIVNGKRLTVNATGKIRQARLFSGKPTKFRPAAAVLLKPEAAVRIKGHRKRKTKASRGLFGAKTSKAG